MNILIIDNYDSFTYNLYQCVGEIIVSQRSNVKRQKLINVIVKRNDEITVEEIKNKGFDRIIISPGPGNPADKKYFGVCPDVLLQLGKSIPVLGVCLGMQGIAHYFGGKVIKAAKPMHGKTSKIQHDDKGVFRNLPQNVEIMRYHSLIAEEKSLPDCLEVTARVITLPSHEGTKTSEIMGLRHRDYPIEGVQFHPESFATEGGKQILTNFLTSDLR